MKPNEIALLMDGRSLLSPDDRPVLIETHISWVILAGGFAYKIKKPVKFSFLDFSSLKKRKFYCERELILNQRLARQMYLQVVPVYRNGEEFSFNTNNGRLTDYAVLMKRMDPTKEMDKMLQKGSVSEAAISALARKLAAFHGTATLIKRPPAIDALRVRFNDLLSVQDFAKKHLGAAYSALIGAAAQHSESFLLECEVLIRARSAEGFVRDLHGDLHTANIFLYPDPVIFDCLEFNDALRELDVLDELAFLAMDLEAYGRKDLSSLLYREYHQLAGAVQNEETRRLYSYYKGYRASVRAKVLLLRAKHTKDQMIKQESVWSARKYLRLVAAYLHT